MRRDVLDQGALGGDGDVISDICRERVVARGFGSPAPGAAADSHPDTQRMLKH
jgi:hypothetical protein